MIIATWRTKTLQVAPEQLLSFDAMNYALEVDVKDKKASKQGYVRKKGLKPKTISFDLPLYAALGADVRGEIEDWMKIAASGMQGRFYVGGSAAIQVKGFTVQPRPVMKPLGKCCYILDSVKANEIHIDANGRMDYAKLSLSFKQSSKS